MFITVCVLGTITVVCGLCLVAYVMLTSDNAVHAGPPSWSRLRVDGRHIQPSTTGPSPASYVC